MIAKQIIGFVFLIFLFNGCATSLKMEPISAPQLSHINRQPHIVGLYISEELKNSQYEVITSPFDRLTYPIGSQTDELFRKCTESVYDRVVLVDSLQPSEPVAFVIQPFVVDFKAIVPTRAFKKEYTAETTYRADVFNSKGNKVFTQTATGEAKLSKSMMSGLQARSICAKVAQKAMQDAAVQIMEGLTSADELK